jgi:hypothetical protein
MNAPSTPDEQRIRDSEHLRLLRIGYFVSAGISSFYALFGLAYVGFGMFVSTTMTQLQLKPGAVAGPPELVGWIFAGVGALLLCFGGAITGLKLYVARCLRERRSHTLCVVVAAFSCLEIPYGTVLGALTFTVLTRPSVKPLFGVDSQR